MSKATRKGRGEMIELLIAIVVIPIATIYLGNIFSNIKEISTYNRRMKGSKPMPYKLKDIFRI
jgi:hypothetical protein